MDDFIRSISEVILRTVRYTARKQSCINYNATLKAILFIHNSYKNYRK